MEQLFQKIKSKFNRIAQKFFLKMEGVYPVGKQGPSLYTIGRLFFKGISEGFIADRAASVAFSFFTALFPLLLFLFTLLPYIPIENFQEDLLTYLHDIIPPQIWSIIDDTITYIITHKSGNLLSVSVILSLYLGTNGISSLFNAFNQTYHSYSKTTNWLKQRWHSLIILMLVIALLSVAVVVLSLGNYFFESILGVDITESRFLQFLFNFIRIAVSVFTLMIAIASLYYFGSPKPRKFQVFSLGNIISVCLIAPTTMGFNYYITNFSRYNILYGSLGTILILTFYIYINAMFILIGFEINASVRGAKKQNGNKIAHKRP